MTTKLTLSIDESMVRRIKQYSKEEGISISKIVEEHFDKITSRSRCKKPDASKLIGILGKAPKDLNWKKERTEYLMKKYGL